MEILKIAAVSALVWCVLSSVAIVIAVMIGGDDDE
jgi:hypothetical protein